tara:strand:- start:2629 stop:3210 length:582 start_codon:yes stop_codon:yes gene_type:complete
MKNKGFLLALIIFGTPFLVISLSTFWYYAGLGPKATVNYGTMIDPPLDLGSLELELNYQPLNIDSMERKWMIIHFLDDRCNEDCLEAFYFSRQINTAIGREKDRVKRFYVASSKTQEKVKKLFQSETNLTAISAKNLNLLRQKMSEAGINPFIQPGFLLADPLGNIILSYQGDIDPKKILSDIKKLLRASKIG